MADHHAQRSALRLYAFANAVHNVGVDQRQVATQKIRIIVLGQARTSPWQKFTSGMPAHIHQRIGLIVIPQPMVETDVLMRWRKGGVGVKKFFIHLPASWRLWPDKDVAEPQTGENQAIIHHHRLPWRLTPTLQSWKVGIGQCHSQSVQLVFMAAFFKPADP